jgi:TPR repeat protein
MVMGGVFLVLMLTCPVDQALAFCDALQKAERGDVDAQQYVALAYQDGLGVKQDECAAIEWYQKAAAAGSAPAMSAIGVMFEVRQEYAMAFEWYSRAARNRDAHAIYRLAIMYQEGLNVTRDRGKAVRLLEDAAWLDSSDAQHYLGLLYFQGERVPQSYVTSYAWLTIAAAKGARYARTRELIEKHLSPQQLAEARKLSSEWADKLATDKIDKTNRK